MPHEEFSELTINVTYATNSRNSKTIARTTLYLDKTMLDPRAIAASMLRVLAEDVEPTLDRVAAVTEDAE